MALAQQVADLELGGAGAVVIAGFDADEAEADPVGGVAAAQLADHGGDRDIGVFVLVGAKHGPLRHQHPDHREGLVADAQAAAEGRADRHQFVAQVRADHHHIAGRFEILLAQEAALGHLKAAHRQEIGGDAGDGTAGTARPRLHHLIEGDLGDNPAHAGHLLEDGLGVFEHQGFREINPLAPGVVVAGHHEQHVGAQGVELAFGQVLGPLADPHQGDHRGVANDDAQHRQQAAQPVGLEGGERHRHRFAQGQLQGHQSGRLG